MASSKLPPPPPPEVVSYMLKELPALKTAMFPLWKELLAHKVTWWNAIFRKELGNLEKRYNGCAIQWADAVEKVADLNKFISHDDPQAQQKIGVLMIGGYVQQMQEHEQH